MITDKQKETRKKGLGSSDVARIMTGNAVRVALEKMGELEKEPLDQILKVKVGRKIETAILDSYEKQELIPIERSPDTIHHPKYPWLLAHPDGIRFPNICIESKLVGWYNKDEWGQPGTDQVPSYVLWQTQAQMSAADCNLAHIPVLFIDEESWEHIFIGDVPPIRIYVVPRDKTLEAYFVEKTKQVWDCIVEKRLPEAEKFEDVKILYKRGVGGAVEATEEMVVAFKDLVDAQARKKLAEQDEKRAKFLLTTFLKDATELRYNQKTLATWRNDSDGEKFDVEVFERDHPDLFRKYLKPTTGARKFLPKPKALGKED